MKNFFSPENQNPESEGKGIVSSISDFIDRLNYSHGWNREVFENVNEQMGKQVETAASAQIQSLLSYRNNLLALVGGLTALVGLLVNSGLKDETSFKIGFTALLLSVCFAIVQAIVVASMDIAAIQVSLEKALEFKKAVGKHLAEVKKFEFGSKRKKEFELAVKAYSDYIEESKRSFVKRFGQFAAL